MTKIKKVLRKRCPQGEVYVFRNGKAKVPGFQYYSGRPVYITLAKFNSLNERERRR